MRASDRNFSSDLRRFACLIEQAHLGPLHWIADRNGVPRNLRLLVDEVLQTDGRLCRPQPIDQETLRGEMLFVELRVSLVDRLSTQHNQAYLGESLCPA